MILKITENALWKEFTMKFNFKKYAKHILTNRTKEVFYHFSKNNKKFAILSNDIAFLQDKLIEKLGEDQNIFFDYEEMINHSKSLILERAYLQGCVDGMRISKFYNQISKGEF
jgi:hypothetical protein